ncbi:phosphoribosyltransferase family protein [Arthrobacter sp. NPDC097144]|uniref:phosphoribosyltransferase family protein n=1 Tax=Arthrobacter sp. NPDC097144 TaxID=3363946 RepID=UPI0038057B26
MSSPAEVETARQSALKHFQWIDGQADTWSMLGEPESLRAVVRGLAHLAAQQQPNLVVGIESRGFALAPAVALALGVGFCPIRKSGSLFPGDVAGQLTEPDYRGNRTMLLARKDQFTRGQRVVLVDDWIQTGSQAGAAAKLISSCGAEVVGVIVIVDEASREARLRLPPVRALLSAAELP